MLCSPGFSGKFYGCGQFYKLFSEQAALSTSILSISDGNLWVGRGGSTFSISLTASISLEAENKSWADICTHRIAVHTVPADLLVVVYFYPYTSQKI